MPSLGETSPTGPAYWRSLDELADTPAFREMLEREFPSVAAEALHPTTRRHFLKLMGASLGLAGLAGCRWPMETIVPYANRPDDRTPGVPARYATSMEIGGVASGLLVTSIDGRPIKIEGNPDHPINRGATDAFAQASLLELYDPDRSRTVIHREGGQAVSSDWDAFAAFARDHFGQLRDAKGGGLAVLSEASSSPTLRRLRERYEEAFPQAGWYEYEPISRDNEREGIKLAFGQALRPHLHLDQADVIVSLDADILMRHPTALKNARDFAARRTGDDGTMNRLYAFESTYTVTGSMADHRVPLSPGHVPLSLGMLDMAAFAASISPDEPEDEDKFPEDFGSVIKAAAGDLADHQGRCVIVAGPHLPPEVHAAVHTLNAQYGNIGKTITYSADPDADRPTHLDGIKQLAADIENGTIKTLVLLGGNAAYDAPADLKVPELLAKVPTSIHLSGYRNETSEQCAWHLPRAHYLESWGDARSWDGTLCAVQPLIAPLYGGRTPVELLSTILGDDPVNGYELVRETFRGLLDAGEFEPAWRKTLHDGLVLSDQGRSATVTSPPEPRANVRELLREQIGRGSASLPVLFAADSSTYDGRFANNGWLQETPDPLTKLTWDNAALIDPLSAKLLDITTGDVVKVTVNGTSSELPAYVMPGQAMGVIVLPLGYGRKMAGRVGDDVGTNTYALRTTDAFDIATNASIEKTGRTYPLACTQDHHAIDTVGMEARAKRVPILIREATLEHYKEHPDFAEHMQHVPPLKSLWTEHKYEGRRWGMSIDLTKCIGCNACVVACQAENNIPVVGKEQVGNGREMHWIRVDRYFRGDIEAPEAVHQPVACHHCENAPCEQVCPVAATVHSSEGLNDMVYNRCVGTRYCSNNCPYKVRRFNYFNYRKDLKDNELSQMILNPEVTVRSRGVMEKCTFCVQRIEAVKIAAKNDGRPIRDGEITPACAQVCPTQAIVFGDLNDEQSRVRADHDHPRSYAMLAELNVKPRTAYLAKLRNPAPGLEPEHEPGKHGVDHGAGHGDNGHDDHGGGHDEAGH